MALLVLLQAYCQRHGVVLQCVTVNHGLRPEAVHEAATVARFCKELNVPHQTLVWAGWDGAGNVQAEARKARYRLMADWAREENLSGIALGHTRDDQAETVLMRLARGAGVDGLSAMSPRREQHGMTWLRPLLGTDRSDLRAFLVEEGIAWVDDPSNEDSRYERIKARQSWDALAPLGITPTALAQVAENMQSARAALAFQTRAAAETCIQTVLGAVRITPDAYRALPDEIARRLMLAVLAWLNSAVYAPRRRSLDAARQAVFEEGAATVDGCHMKIAGGSLWVFREYNAVKDFAAPLDESWDNRWRIKGPAKDGCRVAALGAAGLAACPDWRDLGVPREALLPTPAIWQGNDLIAAPLVNPRSEWCAYLTQPEISFF